MIKKLFRALPSYSLLFGIYPVLSLFATNRIEMRGVEAFLILRPLVVSALFVFLVYLVFWPLMSKPPAGELATFLFLVLFYSYGHVDNLFSLREIPTNLLMPFWIVSLSVGLILIFKYRENVRAIKKPLMLITGLLLCFPIYELAAYTLATQNTQDVQAANVRLENTPSGLTTEIIGQPDEIYPSDYAVPFDVYYIILDGYGRADILAEIYQYDNQPFINELKDRGFYVAQNSYANYNQTRMSVPSSLNMAYLQNLGFSGSTAFDLKTHYKLLSDSKVFEQFSDEAGYTLANFRSGYEIVDIQTLDTFKQIEGDTGVHLSDLPLVYLFGRPIALSNFEILLLQTTMLKPFLQDMVQSASESHLYQDHRDRIEFIFDHLPDFASAPSNYFVYAHIPAPHPPFVFYADGTPRENFLPFDMSDGSQYLTRLGDRDEYLSRYAAQVSYINERILQTIDAIIVSSENPPLIILQGDHGPGAYFDWESSSNSNLPERFGILNAYYFPDKNYENLYPSISPVNSFRVVLGQYFGVKMTYLEDRSFFSDFQNPYGLEEITAQLY